MPKENSFLQNHKKEIVFTVVSFLTFIFIMYFLFFNNSASTVSPASTSTSTSYTSRFGELFGFSGSESDNKDTSNAIEQGRGDDDLNLDVYTEDLIKVWDRPVAGYSISYKEYDYSFINDKGEEVKEKRKSGILNFLDSESGSIYQKDLSAPTSSPKQIVLGDEKYKNIQKAVFIKGDDDNIKKIIFQYLDKNQNIKTVMASISEYFNTAAKLQNIIMLPDNITDLSASPENKKVVYLVSRETNVGGEKDVFSDWYLISDADSSSKQIYSSPLTIWNLAVADNGDIYAWEIDTSFEENYLYKLDIALNVDGFLKNKLIKLYGDRTGLSFLMNKNNLLVSANTGSGLQLFLNQVFFNNKFIDKNLKPISFKTLAGKCAVNFESVFALCAVPKELGIYDAGIIDAWYQGITNFADDIYYLDLKSLNAAKVYNLSLNAFANFDATSLMITKSDTHLILINKYDRSLWTLNVFNLLNTTGE